MSELLSDSLLSTAYGGDWPVKPPSIWSSLEAAATAYPERLALASLHQPADIYGINQKYTESNYLRWSYAQLWVAVERMTRSLLALGVKPGMSIATFLHNNAEYVISFWTALRLGCTFVPLNPRTLSNKEEAAHMLATGAVVVVIIQDSHMAELYDGLSGVQERTVIRLVVEDPSQNSQWTSFTTLMELPDHTSIATEIIPNVQHDTDDTVHPFHQRHYVPAQGLSTHKHDHQCLFQEPRLGWHLS